MEFIIRAVNRQGGGNADVFVNQLRAGDQDGAIQFLKIRMGKAERRRCDRLLLSTEILYHLLADEQLNKSFFDAIAKSGLDQTCIALIFREPISHSISAFCHRAGSRHLEPFETWIADDYEGPGELATFLDLMRRETSVGWILMPYGTTDLLREFCEELGLPHPPETPRQRVNRSMTLSEAEFVRRSCRDTPEMVSFLRDAFKGVAPEKKAHSRDLETFIHNCASRQVSANAKPYQELGKLLGTDLLGDAQAGGRLSSQYSGSAEIPLDLSQEQLRAVKQARQAFAIRRRPMARIRKLVRRGWLSAINRVHRLTSG